MRFGVVFAILLGIITAAVGQPHSPGDQYPPSGKTCPTGPDHSCHLEPCTLLDTCPKYPSAQCRNYRCGPDCRAEFYVNGREVTMECPVSAHNLLNAVFDPNTPFNLGSINLQPAPAPNQAANPALDKLLSSIDLSSLKIPGLDVASLIPDPFGPANPPPPGPSPASNPKPGTSINTNPTPSPDPGPGAAGAGTSGKPSSPPASGSGSGGSGTAAPKPPANSGCPGGKPIVRCVKPPCEVNRCPAVPGATCKNDYCGGCNAKFFQGTVEVTPRCFQPKPPSPTPPGQSPAQDLLNSLLPGVLGPAKPPANAPQPNANAQLNALVSALTQQQAPAPAPAQSGASQLEALAALGLLPKPQPKPNPLAALLKPQPNALSALLKPQPNPLASLLNPQPNPLVAALLPKPQPNPLAALGVGLPANTGNIGALASLLNGQTLAAALQPPKPATNKLLGKCPMFVPIRQCPFSPCSRSVCPGVPGAQCQDYNCGTCGAKFFLKGKEVTSVCLARQGRARMMRGRRGGRMGHMMGGMMMADMMF